MLLRSGWSMRRAKREAVRDWLRAIGLTSCGGRRPGRTSDAATNKRRERIRICEPVSRCTTGGMQEVRRRGAPLSGVSQREGRGHRWHLEAWERI